MATPGSLTTPATGTAAPLECEPALLMKFNPFSQILELFGEGNALEWIDSLQGVQAVSVREAWLTLPGIHSRGGCTQSCAQRPCNAPLLSQSIPCHTALSQMNHCLLGNGDFLISGLLHQPGVISQQPQSCWFHNLTRNSRFSRASHFTPTFVLGSCSHEMLPARLVLSSGQCLWSRRSQILEVTHYLGTWPTDLDCFPFTNLLTTVL